MRGVPNGSETTLGSGRGVGHGSWAVNLLAEEKEKQLQAMVAGTEKKGEAEETPTLQQLMAVMQQMQGVES